MMPAACYCWLPRLLVGVQLLAVPSPSTPLSGPAAKGLGKPSFAASATDDVGYVGAVELDIGNFTAAVSRSARPFVIEFKSLYCGTCQAFDPEFQAVVRQLGGRLAWWENHFNFGVVILEHDAGLELAEQEGALRAGVPAVYIYDPASMRAGHNRRVEVSIGEVVPATKLRSLIVEASHQLERDQEGV